MVKYVAKKQIQINRQHIQTDHFICLHCKLDFVVTELFALAVGILDLL